MELDLTESQRSGLNRRPHVSQKTCSEPSRREINELDSANGVGSTRSEPVTGRQNVLVTFRPSMLDRLRARTDANGGLDACWEWQGATNSKGYGVIAVDGKARVVTHCAQGHPLSGDNLGGRRDQRSCRICNREAQRRFQERASNTGGAR